MGCSLARCDWLAIIIRGRSHSVSMSRGVDNASEKNIIDKFRVLSVNWLARGIHKRLIIRLCAVELIQIILGLDNHVRGTSIIVGIMIFSIVEGSDFVHSLFRR